jgi:hypothetical protein
VVGVYQVTVRIEQVNASSLFQLLFLLSSCGASASHVRPFAWRPIDHGQSYHVLGPSAEADAPGGDAEALTCAIICPRGDADAQCFGLDLGGWPLAGGKLGAQPGNRCVDHLRAWRWSLAGKSASATLGLGDLGEADLVSLADETAPTTFCRRPTRSGSKLSRLESRLRIPAVKAALRPGLWFGYSAPCSSSHSWLRICLVAGRGCRANERSYQLVSINLLSHAKFRSQRGQWGLETGDESTAIGALRSALSCFLSRAGDTQVRK